MTKLNNYYAICDDLAEYPGLREDCVQNLPNGMQLQEIDQGFSFKDYSQDIYQPITQLEGKDDGELSPQEYLLWRIDQDIAPRLAAHYRDGLKEADELFANTGIRLNFLFRGDALAQVRQFSRETQKSLRKNRGENENDSTIDWAKAFSEFVETDLGVVAAPSPTLDVNGTIARQEAECVGFASLYYGLGVYQGLNPIALSLEPSESSQKYANHAAIGFVKDHSQTTQDLYFIDSARQIYGDSPLEENFMLMSSLEFLVRIYANQVQETVTSSDSQPGELREHVGTMLLLGPKDIRALGAAISFYEKQGDLEMAKELYHRATQIFPQSHLTKNFLKTTEYFSKLEP